MSEIYVLPPPPPQEGHCPTCGRKYDQSLPSEYEPIRELLMETFDEIVGAQADCPPMRSLHEGYAILDDMMLDLLVQRKELQPRRNPETIDEVCIRIAAMALRIRLDLTAGKYAQ